MSLQNAIYQDTHGEIVQAAASYEQVIQSADAPLEAFLNLAVLYWQCTDFGFHASHQLDMDFVHTAAGHYSSVLQQAEQRFAGQPEILFWKLYCDFITLGTPPFVEECERLVRGAGDTLVPYFYLYAAYDGRQYEEEAHLLRADCLKQRTVKNQYIVSVIEGVTKRARVKAKAVALA